MTAIARESTKPIQISASKLKLTDDCPGWVHLPKPKEKRRSVYGDKGDRFHAFMEVVLSEADVEAGHRRALAECQLDDEIRDMCVDLDLRKVKMAAPQGYKREIELATSWDPVSQGAKRLGNSIGREYRKHGAPEGWLNGTADLVAVDEQVAREAIVTDWKTGFSWIEHPKGNHQLWHLSVAVACLFDVDQVTACIGKVWDDGRIFVTWHTFDAMELVQMADKLSTIWFRAADMDPERPELYPGDQCHWCPVNTNCPELARAAESLLPLNEREVKITPETAPTLWSKAEAVKAAADKAMRALEAYAREHPFTLPDGRVVKERTKMGNEKVMPNVALDLLSDELEWQEVKECVSISKAAIKRVLGNADGEEFIRKLRKEGAIRKAPSQRVTAEKED